MFDVCHRFTFKDYQPNGLGESIDAFNIVYKVSACFAHEFYVDYEHRISQSVKGHVHSGWGEFGWLPLRAMSWPMPAGRRIWSTSILIPGRLLSASLICRTDNE